MMRFARVRSVDMLQALPRTLKGTVTRVGDADNFHLFHQPFWYRARPPKKLKGETVHVRLAAVDAPEMAHFGQKAQPYSSEAYDWLKQKLLGRRVIVDVQAKDRFGRVVGLVYLPRWFGLRRECVAHSFLVAGLCTVYGQAGAVYGGRLAQFERAQLAAQKAGRGMWQQGAAYESPAEYKAKHRTGA